MPCASAARLAAGGGSRSAGPVRNPRAPPLRPEWLREAGGQVGNGLPPGRGPAPTAGLGRVGEAGLGRPRPRGYGSAGGRRGERPPAVSSSPFRRWPWVSFCRNAGQTLLQRTGRRRPLAGTSLSGAAEHCLHTHNWHHSVPGFLMSSRGGRRMAFPEETGNRSTT